MNKESRRKRVEEFFNFVEVKYGDELEKFLDEIGVEIVEDLKLVIKEDWVISFENILQLKRVQK